VQPVTAVPGIPEDAQHLDSRTALQWAQPVFQGEKGQTTRTSLAVPLAVQIVKPLNIKGFEPQGPDPDALLKGDVHPMLAEGLASWINFVASKPAPEFRYISKPVQNDSSRASPRERHSTETQIHDNADVIEAPKSVLSIDTLAPETNEVSPQVRPSFQVKESMVLPALLNVYEALAGSEIFAAQRLAEAWLPRKSQPQIKNQGLDLPQESNTKDLKEKYAKHIVLNLEEDDSLEAFKALSEPISKPSFDQLSRWVSALEPESESAQQAAHMLTHGQMTWLAELAPGVTVRMVREDAWRNDRQYSAQLEKGAMLRVELNLPNLGRIRVVGSQWGQDLSLQVFHDITSLDQWSALAPELLKGLQSKGIGEVRVGTFSNEDEMPNG